MKSKSCAFVVLEDTIQLIHDTKIVLKNKRITIGGLIEVINVSIKF
jgi:hypothetical protein